MTIIACNREFIDAVINSRLTAHGQGSATSTCAELGILFISFFDGLFRDSLHASLYSRHFLPCKTFATH